MGKGAGKLKKSGQAVNKHPLEFERGRWLDNVTLAPHPLHDVTIDASPPRLAFLLLKLKLEYIQTIFTQMIVMHR